MIRGRALAFACCLVGAAATSSTVWAAEPAGSSGAAVSPKQSDGGPAAPGDAAPGEEGVPEGPSLFPIEGDKPLSVRSEELEAIEDEGRRRLVFTRNVQVEQEDLTVKSNRLEAFYPAGASQPDKLVATGDVRVTEGDRTMLCDTATYFRAEERILCVGNAELRQANDRVRGREIEIFPRQNRVKVRGGALVNVAPESEPQPGARAAKAGKAER